MNWNPCHSEMPGIPIDSDSIEIIGTPEEFYETLLKQIQKAEHRISLSSLYLGTGSKEHALVSAIRHRVEASNVQLTILLDLLRGTRFETGESSVTVLQSISGQGKVFLYHTPMLRGFLKKILPVRADEVVGLQHMKIYIFDDNLLISGANLSSSYFANRQDRYYLLKNCKPLADFFQKIIDAVGESSFILQKDAVVQNSQCEVHPYQGNIEQYQHLIKNRVEKVINDFKISSKETSQKHGTFVYPLLQMGFLGINQEVDFLRKVFGTKVSGSKVFLASGYFNITEEYENLIRNVGEYEMDILTASPYANGFFESSGFSKYIPSLYSYISKMFLERRNDRRCDTLHMHEYFRNGWTFHAKGLWIEDDKMMTTMIGSSNFGYRSTYRDLEAQIVVVTREKELISRISEEKNKLFKYSSILDNSSFQKPEHHVPIFVRLLSRLVRSFL